MSYTISETILGCLLHDVGKLLQRAYGRIEETGAKRYGLESTLCPTKNGDSTHKHVLFTNAFFDLVRKENLFFPEGVNCLTVEHIASYHHKPGACNMPGAAWLCTLGDHYSAGMDRRADEESAQRTSSMSGYRTTPLQCIFDELILDEAALGKPERHAYALEELNPEKPDALIPMAWPDNGTIRDLPNRYREVWAGFWAAFKALGRREPMLSFRLFEGVLLGLLERFTWAIPSSTLDSPDISLYDHSRTTAAIAACLHRYHENRGELEDVKAIRNESQPKFRFLAGDLSGIQETLFSLQTQGVRGVNKILRARSFMMSAICEAATLLILDALDLPLSNIFQQAGGRFLILVPAQEDLEKLVEGFRQRIDQWLLERYTGSLALNLALSPPFSAAGFRPAGLREVMSQTAQAVEEAKQRPLSTRSHGVLKREFPLDSSCSACGTRPAEIEDEGGLRCLTCDNEIRVGKRLVRANMIVWGQGLPKRWQTTNVLGLEMGLLDKAPDESLEEVLTVQRTNNDPAPFPWPVKVLANHVPLFRDDYAAHDPRYEWIKDEDTAQGAGEPKSFMHIAAEALEAETAGGFRGRAFLALLKADVDRLGFLFSFGLRRNEIKDDRLTLSRLAQLSRMMDLYFTGYLKGLLHREFPDTYTVYAGGDDLLLIGPWRQTIELSSRINDTFRSYTGHNPNLTLSTGLTLLKPNHPVNRAAKEAEGFLDMAKDEGRNRICALIPKAITWDRYRERLRDADWIHDRMHDEAPVSTSFVYRVLELAGDAEAVTLRGDVRKAGWRARLAYLLARNIKGRGREDTQHRIIEWLERLKLDDQFKLRGEHPNLFDWRLPLSIALYRNRS
ncbi:MAG TPA: type III-A CRISPR-associated protein Cas10/Csm1 [Syntrophobacteraceae bacterium]|nr:type III-A CRISPR-associated protein Cas10/Csm1 [Syntrophobacteraceae bacterium]